MHGQSIVMGQCNEGLTRLDPGRCGGLTLGSRLGDEGPDLAESAGVGGADDSVGLGGTDSAYVDSPSGSGEPKSSFDRSCTLVYTSSDSDMMPWEIRNSIATSGH